MCNTDKNNIKVKTIIDLKKKLTGQEKQFCIQLLCSQKGQVFTINELFSLLVTIAFLFTFVNQLYNTSLK